MVHLTGDNRCENTSKSILKCCATVSGIRADTPGSFSLEERACVAQGKHFGSQRVWVLVGPTLLGPVSLVGKSVILTYLP